MSGKTRQIRNRAVIILLAAAALLGSYFLMSEGDISPVIHYGGIDLFNETVVYQTFNVIYTDGTSRIVYPPEKTSLLVIDDENAKHIKTLQTNVVMNVDYDDSKPLSQWTFKCKAFFELMIGDQLVKDFGVQSLSETGDFLLAKQDTWVTSASITDNDLKGLYNFYPGRLYNFRVTLQDIELTLEYTDGTTKVLTGNQGPTNILKWDFRVI